MTEKLHQSLSSIMDGAGDDLELPRLLNAMQASPELNQQLSDKWRRYHLAQGILKGELRGVQKPRLAQIDISAAVMQQLEDESSNFTDAGAASELGFLQTVDKPAKLAVAASQAPLVDKSTKRQDRGQWLRGGALAASVALLVITGTQIYNLSQESDAAFATQKPLPPMTHPVIEASQVTSTCQSQLFSGVAVINFPVGVTPRKPCVGDIEGFSPLLSSQASRPQGLTPVSSR